MAGGIIGSIIGGVLTGGAGPAIGAGVGAALPSLAEIAKVLADRLIPDPAAREVAAQKIEEALSQREALVIAAVQKEAEQQSAINLQESQSPSIFVAGWRPATAWICVFGFLYSFCLQPLVTWVVGISNAALGFSMPAPPMLDTGLLSTMLLGLLGLGTMRVAEKLNGVAAPNMTAPMAGTPLNPPPRMRR